ncbi:MAG: hypothetical protein FWD73_17600 [Polyangiaceae bacterium]|nr:hypothetical protein [Polyangiaceae bacterium]
MELKSTAEKRIQEAFASVGLEYGGEFFILASTADRYIDACVQESLAIGGIEAFWLQGKKLKPNLNQIADFSSIFTGKDWNSIVRETAAEAHRFVRQIPVEADVRLNFTLLSERE